MTTAKLGSRSSALGIVLSALLAFGCSDNDDGDGGTGGMAGMAGTGGMAGSAGSGGSGGMAGVTGAGGIGGMAGDAGAGVTPNDLTCNERRFCYANGVSLNGCFDVGGNGERRCFLQVGDRTVFCGICTEIDQPGTCAEEGVELCGDFGVLTASGPDTAIFGTKTWAIRGAATFSPFTPGDTRGEIVLSWSLNTIDSFNPFLSGGGGRVSLVFREGEWRGGGFVHNDPDADDLDDGFSYRCQAARWDTFDRYIPCDGIRLDLESQSVTFANATMVPDLGVRAQSATAPVILNGTLAFTWY